MKRNKSIHSLVFGLARLFAHPHLLILSYRKWNLFWHSHFFTFLPWFSLFALDAWVGTSTNLLHLHSSTLSFLLIFFWNSKKFWNSFSFCSASFLAFSFRIFWAFVRKQLKLFMFSGDLKLVNLWSSRSSPKLGVPTLLRFMILMFGGAWWLEDFWFWLSSLISTISRPWGWCWDRASWPDEEFWHCN